MNPFDMAIIVIIGYTTIQGLFKGLVKEVASIVGLLAGFFAAYWFYPAVADLFFGWMADPVHGRIISFLLLFCFVFALISIFGVLIRLLMKVAFLDIFDRFFGGLFGAFKGILVVSFVFLFLVTFLPDKEAAFFSESKLMPSLQKVSQSVVRMVPQKTKEMFVEKMRKLQHR